jgi:hypothetical protein
MKPPKLPGAEMEHWLSQPQEAYLEARAKMPQPKVPEPPETEDETVGKLRVAKFQHQNEQLKNKR